MPKLFLLLAFVLFSTTTAFAHKVISSAWTDGKDIEGEVGFSNGDMAAPGTLVEVFDPDGNPIGTTKIIEDGLFRFTPNKSIEHRFRTNLGAGHVAEVIVTRDELPEHLQIGAPSQQTNTTGAATPPLTTQTLALPADLQAMISKAVRKEVQPLRKEIASYKEKNDLQSIMGGIGYILGLTGIAFYMATRRKDKKGE
jgi:nickel transport protein